MIIPIVVIEGKLFETYFDATKEEMVIKEQKKMRLHWKGSEAWNLHSTVDIVTIEELDNYVAKLNNETNILINKMTETFSLINKCIENKSIDPNKTYDTGSKRNIKHSSNFRQTNNRIKKTVPNTVHIAGRGLVVRQLRILASQFRVLRTGTRSEIRPDNMYQPLALSSYWS